MRLTTRQAGAWIALLIGAGMALLGLFLIVQALLPGAGMASMGVVIGVPLVAPGVLGMLLARLALHGDPTGRWGSIVFCAVLALIMGWTVIATVSPPTTAERMAACENDSGKPGAVDACQRSVADMPETQWTLGDVVPPAGVAVLGMLAVGLLLFGRATPRDSV